MHAPLQFLSDLSRLARQRNHRYVIQLDGDACWQSEVLKLFVQQQGATQAIKLGGKSLEGIESFCFKSGARFLGMEIDCLIYDDSEGFDANSLTAATGALTGGGLLFLLLSDKESYAGLWLQEHLNQARQKKQAFLLCQSAGVPALPDCVQLPVAKQPYVDQNMAIAAVQKVVTGHRKRPLVMTADRGRGKSASLGIAAATLMNRRKIRILVTAPARKAVDPVFRHARAHLDTLTHHTANSLNTELASLSFISPDELLKQRPECDLLIVDEASAIPVPMLKIMAERHHRMVFSTTVHGYEGCGRGFTLKFTRWLDENRPGWHLTQLTQPIRWQENDPLERWIFDTFLLDAELSPQLSPVQQSELNFVHIEKQTLLTSNRLRDCFALLVNAHYQTSPNDLVHILQDPKVHLFVCQDSEGRSIGCVLVNREGGVEPELVLPIMAGERRPKGQLVSGTIGCQLGFEQGLTQTGLRIMRIAVHPEYQQQNIGSWMLTQLRTQQDIDFDYIATSYGVTVELLRFWRKNGFVPLRLGANRDQASGTHSLLMIDRSTPQPWIEQAYTGFVHHFAGLLYEVFAELDPELIVAILSASAHYFQPEDRRQTELVQKYCQGNCLYESVCSYSRRLALSLLTNRASTNARDVTVIVAKLLQARSWQQVAQRFGFVGRKETEQQLRHQLDQLLRFTV